MAAEKGVDQIYVALEKLKDVEISGAAAGSPEVAAVEPQFDTLILHVHDPDIKVRNLLASEIPNYLHWFSSEPSMNAMLDLCEDSEPTVRISAVRGLQRFCEKAPTNVGRISDVLGQLLSTEDGAELKAVQAAFAGTIRVDFSAALVTLVDLITNAETPESLRTRQLAFLREQLQSIVKESHFTQNVIHQRTLFAQLRLLFLNASGSLLPLSDAESIIETAKNVKIARTEPASIDLLASAVIESFEKQLNAKAVPFSEALQYFGAVCKKLGAPAAKGPATSVAYMSFFINHFMPLWTPNLPPELATPMQIFLKMLSYASEKISDSLAAEAIPKLWDFLKTLSARPKSLSTVIQIFEIECVLVSFVSVCSKNASAVKSVLGVFVPTGQPSDFRADLTAKREALQTLISHLNTEATAQLATLTKTSEEYKKLIASTNDGKQKQEIKESVQKLHAPIQGLNNIIVIAKSLSKQRPVFNRSGVTMSWVPAKKPDSNAQKGPEKKGQTPKQGQPAQKGQPNQKSRKQNSGNNGTPKNRGSGDQNTPTNPAARKRNRQVVIENQNNKKQSVKRKRRH